MGATVNVLSLFAGVGGMELGLERAGMTTVGQVEIDPYCQQVLNRHWPEVPKHDDVTTTPEWWVSDDRPTVDLICGGFPCQPFSLAGRQAGVSDERWMWPETERVIRAIRPRYVLLENVAALVRDSVAFGTVLADLHQLGFDAEWGTIPASDFGLPTIRERVYVLAYSAGVDGFARGGVESRRGRRSPLTVRGLCGLGVAEREQFARDWLAVEPRVGRLVDGVPNQSHRLRVIGNAVCPPVAEHLGKLILEHDCTGLD